MTAPSQRARVLVADDDPPTLRMLARMVDHWGLEPVLAQDGNQALAVLSEPKPPDRALVDWMMPGLSGPDVCRRARAAGSRTHIVLLTARDRSECVVEGLEAGADDYVIKPFDHAVLRARLLRGHPASPPVPAERIGPGLVIGGRFRLESLLGEGGMGAVYRAVHVEIGHSVAIKVMRPSLAAHPLLRARFETEARATSSLRSPYVARLYDYGVTPGSVPYLIMEELQGRTLGSFLASRGRTSLNIVSRIVTEVARGLAVAHAAGIVHRDVKPENVFLEDLGDDTAFPHRAKLLDFGLARLLQSSGARQTGRGHFVGTLGFAAPEQLLGHAITPRTDLWALGATAYAAATGQAAIAEGSEGHMVAATCAGDITPPSAHVPQLPRAFDEWVRTACDPDPTARFCDAASMAAALRVIAAPA